MKHEYILSIFSTADQLFFRLILITVYVDIYRKN